MKKHSHTATNWEQIANEVCNLILDFNTGFGDFCVWKTEKVIQLVQLYWLYRTGGETRNDIDRYTQALNQFINEFYARNTRCTTDVLFKTFEDSLGSIYSGTPDAVRVALQIPLTFKER